MNYCKQVHHLFRNLTRHKFPFKENEIPQNGIYILFEKGEKAHGGDRIVRIGTHTGKDQLRSRLKQHFIFENKDRSIFRKNIGRALLSKTHDPFLNQWEIDLTPRLNREKYSCKIDKSKLAEMEQLVTEYMQNNFSFTVFEIPEKENRLTLESKLISTVSLCRICGPSDGWLGLNSPKPKIRGSGLWLVNELYKEPLALSDLNNLNEMLEFKIPKFIEDRDDLINSVSNFMKAPEHWREAIASHPKYFLHYHVNGKEFFGLSKFSVFKDIDLHEYITEKRYETDGGTAKKHERNGGRA